MSSPAITAEEALEVLLKRGDATHSSFKSEYESLQKRMITRLQKCMPIPFRYDESRSVKDAIDRLYYRRQGIPTSMMIQNDQKTSAWSDMPEIIDKIKRASYLTEAGRSHMIANLRATVLPKQPHREPEPYKFEFDNPDDLLDYLEGLHDAAKKGPLGARPEASTPNVDRVDRGQNPAQGIDDRRAASDNSQAGAGQESV